ncbi:DNA-binding response regulator [Paenibacillus lignilyticus]|uniref:DNA-binding response regulator n=1 Tax=Paenibacillus lignilyticus TaxID=1172615 RepID=A0ABS5CCF8_9BACL|nr:DNA-binding response regulator [Paenibacillus lignilyticus]MBP3961680.1 DNA-binding response regulator [Paenibacillus lignilyticus]MBP3963649.1 DNA-binding response regulator [Paenibacillus lignilyticus]
MMVAQEFEQAYTRMMEQAMESGSEERKRRLSEYGEAEKALLQQVWWPAVGSLDYLHPQYELVDLKGGTRFADFAYCPPLSYQLLLEVDGFGPHWRDISRWKFADDLCRQNHLLIEGWKLLRFAYDEVMEKPRRSQQTLLMGLAKWGGIARPAGEELSVYERALLHLMQECWGELTPVAAAKKMGISRGSAAKHLRSLVSKGLLVTKVSGTGRIMRYKLSTSNLSSKEVGNERMKRTRRST